jgi:hypothetical protein
MRARQPNTAREDRQPSGDRERISTSLKNWATRNRDPLTIGILFFAITSVPPVLAKGGNPLWVVIVLNLAMMGFLLLQRASVGEAITRLRNIVIYDLGLPWSETQYSRRSKHFVEEKELLADCLVDHILPDLLEKIRQEAAHPQVQIILDSGTTITPMFEKLARKGISLPTNAPSLKIEFFTNNLAGIEELQKLDHLSHKKLSEEDFTLIGGTPLGRYRATTGKYAEEALGAILSNSNQRDNGTRVKVGIVTANWLLVGHGHDSISLCARGRGHPEFKKLVIDKCDYLIIVAPLGKVLALDDERRLNDLLPRESDIQTGEKREYDLIPIEQSRKSKTFLLTSQRPIGSISPLKILSSQIFNQNPAVCKNFILHLSCPEYSPPGSTEEVRMAEMPHSWTRKYAKELFGEVH